MEKEKIDDKILDLKVIKRIFVFVHPYLKAFWLLVFLTLALAVVVPIRPYLIQLTIDQEVALGDSQGLVWMMGLLVALLVVQAFVQYGHTYLSGWLGQHIIRDMRVRLYTHAQQLRLKYFDQTPIGRLVTRNVSDIETLATVFSDGIAMMIGDLMQLVVILLFMFYTDWKLTLVSLSTLPVLIASSYIFKEKVKVAFNHVRTAVSNLNAFVQEHITGMSIVQIFNSEAAELKKFKAINAVHQQANLRAVLYYSIYFPVAEVIQAIGIGLVVWYGALKMIDAHYQPGILIAFIMYIQMFFRPIRMIADRFNTLQMGIVSSNRIVKLLDNDELIPNTGSHRPTTLHGHVAFRHVWFAYGEEQYVLRDISFEVDAGKTMAMVGATGAGKSSVVHLLNRFYDIDRGGIAIDHRDIREYELHTFRRHIGVVSQDVFLFSNSIRQNITLGDESITDEVIWKAAGHVGVDEFIRRLPDGLDYNVMERGASLSMGQRQLIAFVRAMVYDPKIIVLDEATSSVDTETEELIQNAIQTMMKGRTSIVIAHRLSTIQDADHILVLDQGEIKERGTHETLLEKNGLYARLHSIPYQKINTASA